MVSEGLAKASEWRRVGDSWASGAGRWRCRSDRLAGSLMLVVGGVGAVIGLMSAIGLIGGQRRSDEGN